MNCEVTVIGGGKWFGNIIGEPAGGFQVRMASQEGFDAVIAGARLKKELYLKKLRGIDGYSVRIENHVDERIEISFQVINYVIM